MEFKDSETRIVSFKIRRQDLQEVLDNFQMSGSGQWKSNPTQIIEDGDNLIVVVRVFGDYPYMDSLLRDVGNQWSSKIEQKSHTIKSDPTKDKKALEWMFKLGYIKTWEDYLRYMKGQSNV